MKRDVKFRGKRKDNGEWVYGYHVFDEKHCILDSTMNTSHISNVRPVIFGVDKETVGQYKGKKDKNKVEIYEDDIIEIMSRGLRFTCIVGEHLSLIPCNEQSKKWDIMLVSPDWENSDIIGNIHDNPELLND